MTVSGKDRRRLVEQIRTLQTRLDALERRKAELLQAHLAERRKTEEIPAASELQYHETFDAMGDAIHVVDSELRIVQLNEEFRRWGAKLGLDTAHAVGRTIFDVFPFLPETVRDEYRRVFEEGRVLTTEDVTRVAGGEIVTETRKIPIRQDGRVVRIITVIRDITDRKVAERQIRERARIIDSTTDSVIKTDRDGIVTMWNRGAERIFGYTSEEMIGRPVSVLYSQQGQSRLAEIIQTLLRGEEITTTEVTCMHKDGSPVELALSLLPLKDDDGNVTEFVGISKDITERKRIQDALRQSENRYRTVIENAGEGIIVVQDGMLRFVNSRHPAVTGRSEEESTSRPFIEFVHPDDRKLVMDIHTARLKGERVPQVYEFRIIDKDGQIRWLENNGVVIEWDGRPASLNFLRNVTGRKKAEQALKISEERFRLAQQASKTGVWERNLETDEVYWSQNIEPMFGLKPGSFERSFEAFMECILPEDRKRIGPEVSAAIRNGRGFRVEYRIVHPDGGIHWMIEDAQIFNGIEGKPTRLVGTIRDITERKKAEEQLRKERDKAQQYLDVARVVFVALDVEGRVTLINKKGSEILGYPERDIIGKNWFDNFLPERLREQVKHVFGELAVGRWEPVEYFENPILTRSGQERLIAWHNVTVRDIAGNVAGCLSSGEDITEQRKAQDDLLEQTHLQQILLDSMPCVAMLLRPGSREIVASNKAAVEVGVVPGKTCYQTWAGSDAPCPWCLAPEVWATGQPRHCEPVGEGGKAWDAHWIPVSNDLYMHFAFNVTERKQAERILRETTALLETIFAHTHILVAYLDAKFNFVRVNRAYAEADGCEPSFFVGRNHFDLYPNTENESIFRKVVEIGVPYFAHAKPFEYAGRPERSVTYWDWSLVPIKDQDGTVSGLVLTLVNVTEQKRAEQALRESEERFRKIFEEGPVGMVLASRDMKFFSANPAFCRMLGYTAEEMSSKTFLDVTHPAHRETDRQNIEKMWRGEIQHYATEKRYLARNGDIRWGSVSATLLRGQDGKPSYAIAIVEDITDRKQAEESLRKSEERFRQFFENEPEYCYMVSPEGTILDVNAAALKALGRTKDELLGQPLRLIYAPESLEKITALFEKWKRGESIQNEELVIVAKDGKQRTVLLSASFVKDSDGQIVHSVSVQRDITELKRAEEILLEREATLTSIFRTAPVGIGLERDGLLVRVNDQVCSMIGYSREELVGRHAAMFYPTQDHYERVRQANRPQILEKGTAAIETQWKRKDGRIIDVLLSTTFLDPADLMKGVTFTALDITERKAAEEAIRDSEEKFRTLADQSPNMIFINNQGRIVYANKKCEEIMEYTREEFYSPDFDFRRLVAPESADVIRKSFAMHLQGRDVESYEYCLISKTGRRIEAINTSRLIPYEGQMAILGIVTDITSHKQAEERLRLSEERLRRAQSMAHIGNWEWDLRKGTLHWEEENYSMFGLPRETVPSVETFFATIHPDDLDTVQRSMDAALRGEPYELDFRIRRLEDGDERVIHAYGQVNWDPEGKPVRFFGTVQDITELKKAERAMRESQERFRMLFESAPDAIYLMDLEGRFVDGNKAAEEMVGFTKSELIGKSLAESGLLSSEDLPKAAANLRKTAAGQSPGPTEYTIRRKSGSPITVEIRTFSVTIGGKILSLGIARDVTARKHAEEAIRASEKKFRSIFETAANLITSVNEQGIIVDCNDRVREFLGYEKEEILGRSMAKIMHPDCLMKAKAAVKEILTVGFMYNHEYKMVRKDGSLIDVSINSSAIEDENGKYARTLCIIDDITERKQVQQRLLDDREQLKSLASQLSLTEERERRRLATALHDHIGQSLVFSKIKLDQVRKSKSTSELTEALNEVSRRLGQVIQDTRTLTFDLSDPILYELGFEAAVAEWLTEQLQEKHGIETEFVDDGQPKPLDDDIRALLFRNVREVLVNVIKHAQARHVKITVGRADKSICVSIEDDGVGFNPVEAAAMALKKAEFGLFSIRKRLEQLGGCVEIESGSGRGTKIRMTAPLKQEHINDGMQR